MVDSASRVSGLVGAFASSPTYKPLSDNGATRWTVPSQSPQPHKKVDVGKDLVTFESWNLRGLRIRNRVIRAAAFDGAEVEQIVATHEGVSKGGVGMTVVAYCCTSDDGRTFEEQVNLKDRKISFAILRPVVEAAHKHGAAICAQLTHGGSFSAPHLNPGHLRNIAPSIVFSPGCLEFPREMNENDMKRLEDEFAESAKFAVNEIGFDCVELHCGHGYMLSQWMSPVTNTRTDQYGGSAENRARFPLRCFKAIREALHKDVPILIKMNCQDGFVGGLELPDAIIMAEIFADAGADMLVISAGFVSINAFYLLRGTTPLEKLILALPGIKKWACFLFGPLGVPSVPYDDCFLRDSARAILNRLKQKNSNTGVCLLGGVSSLTQMEGAMEEGFMAVQMARPLIREPDFLQRIQRETQKEKAKNSEDRDEAFEVETKCIRCNACVISSVDPSKDFGCPFRRLEEASAKNLAAAAGNNAAAPASKALSINRTMALSILPDIEDIRGPRL